MVKLTWKAGVMGPVIGFAVAMSGGVHVSPERFGIGATLTKADVASPVVLRNCFKNGPADCAGLMPGDVLMELDGQVVTSWSLQAVIDYLVRDKPLPVQVTVRRGTISVGVELVRARLSDIAAGMGLRYELMPDSTSYRIVPLSEQPTVEIGATMSPADVWDSKCRNAQFSPNKEGYTFLYFWSSWCGPCKELMRELAKYPIDLSRTRVVGVNVDESCETFTAAVDSLHPSGEQFWAGGWYGALPQSLQVHRRGIPTGVLIDRGARLVEVSVGVDSVLSMLRRDRN